MPGRPRRRPTTPAERDHADTARAAKLAALHQTLTDQVTALAAGGQWQRWLSVAARFHTYSLNNTLLLLAQRPDATRVAGYTLWQQLGRQVRRGEKGIAILAPVTRRSTTGDQADNDLKPDDTTSAERDARTTSVRRVVGYRPVHVWDISQTDGDPLPTPPAPSLLTGQAPPGLWDALATRCTAAGYQVTREAIGGAAGPNGYTDFAARRVVVRIDVDGAQAVKTLAHELAHVLLHNPDHFERGRTADCRGAQEVEAESVAYLIAADRGLDTAGYTFAYVSGWATQTPDPAATLRDTATRILTTAHTVLDALDHPAPESAPTALSDLTARAAAGAIRTADLVRELPVQPPEPKPARERLLAATAAAAAFFTDHFGDTWPPAYLAQRLAEPVDPAAYGIGYAPPGWTTLVDHLRGAGYSDAEILAAGLGTRASTGRLVDRFRDRLTFAIHAVSPDGPADVVGFTARRNPAHDDTADGREPKYLNTPQTALYTKGDHLYGLAAGHDVLTRGGLAVLVEGPLDALAVTTAARGTMAALTPLGTALTEQQATQLAAALGAGQRDRVVIATDADPAGHRAAQRAYQLLTAHHLDPRLARLPDGRDPAELAAAHGPVALVEVLAGAAPAAHQLAAAALAGRDLRWAEQRVAAARHAARLIAAAPPDTWQREIHATAQRTELSEQALRAAVIDQAGTAPHTPRPDPALAAHRRPAPLRTRPPSSPDRLCTANAVPGRARRSPHPAATQRQLPRKGPNR